MGPQDGSGGSVVVGGGVVGPSVSLVGAVVESSEPEPEPPAVPVAVSVSVSESGGLSGTVVSCGGGVVAVVSVEGELDVSCDSVEGGSALGMTPDPPVGDVGSVGSAGGDVVSSTSDAVFVGGSSRGIDGGVTVGAGAGGSSAVVVSPSGSSISENLEALIRSMLTRREGCTYHLQPRSQNPQHHQRHHQHHPQHHQHRPRHPRHYPRQHQSDF